MKCPRCGLVHPPVDQACRRCEIDLRTGEASPRAGLRVETGPSRSALEKIKGRIESRKQAPEPEEPEKPGKREKERAETRERHAEHETPAEERQDSARTERKTALASMFVLPGAEKKKQIPCIHCEGTMTIRRSAPFSKAWPFALFGLAAALAAAAFFFPLLWIPAVLAAAAGLLYTRAGKTYWRCQSCGFIIKRSA